MTGLSQRLALVVGVGVGGLTLLLHGSSLYGQNVPTPTPAVAQTAAALPTQPLNMLQEPAKDAQVAFSGDRLTIHADNASLGAILREVAAQSGMKITGMGSDERVFGTFGPAAASDVLADLLNGTSYDVMLIGTASYGAPRELILTPSRGGGQGAGRMPAAAAPAPSVNDDAANEPEAQDVPPPPDAAQPPATPAGMRTPQQLFQQLQQMRQAQQQQIPQQEQPQQQQTQPAQQP